jgi:patatin-like phospholipase/acyl hydrolase
MAKSLITNLNLSNHFSCKLIAASIISLLTTCQHALPNDDEEDIDVPTRKREIVFSSSIFDHSISLDDEFMEIPVITQEIPSSARRSIFSDGAINNDLSWNDIPTVRILSLDGGGVRGIIEARFVQKLSELTGKSVPEMFHIVAGTSVGGILAGGYTLPYGQGDPKQSPPKYSSDVLYNIMMLRTGEMFDKGWSCYGLLGPRYKSSSVERFMNELFGDITFDRTTIDTLIPTFDLSASKPKIFKSWDDREIFYTRDILESTSAAPTYFSPRHIFPVNATSASHPGYTLSDGGTCANNPTACALADARRLYPTATRYEIVSLGTGKETKPLHYSEMKTAGLVGWGRHLIDIFMNGQSTHADYLMETILPDDYSRWNPSLAARNAALDNTSTSNLLELVRTEDDLISSRRSEFERLAERLKEPKADFVPIYAVRR